MQQQFEAANYRDGNDNPSGGYVGGVGLAIEWQNGPLSVDGERLEPNGAFVETVIAAAKQRIEEYQATKFACEENADAIALLELALKRLDYRTRRRTEAGVEGTHRGN
jgi:hypothetical protein